MTEQRENPAEGDLLVGMGAIAAHLGITVRQAYTLKDGAGLPTFKQGATVCARRSTLAEHFRRQEALARGETPAEQGARFRPGVA